MKRSIVDRLIYVSAFVDFVYADDGLFIERQRLFKYISRLRHAPFDRVDEQNDAVYHRKYTFDLSAEVRVTRGVDYVYLGVFVNYGGVLREDGNSSFSLYVAAVHNSFAHGLVIAEDVVLFQKPVYQSRFTVVDVRDYGNVSYVVSRIHSLRSEKIETKYKRN